MSEIQAANTRAAQHLVAFIKGLEDDDPIGVSITKANLCIEHVVKYLILVAADAGRPATVADIIDDDRR